MPLARDVVKDLAVEHGACVRPVQLRRTDLATGADRTRARPVRAHPRLGLPVVRRTGQEPPRRAMPGRLAPRPRTGHRTRRPHRRADVADRDTRRRPGRCATPTKHAAKTSAAGTKSSPNSTSEINNAGMRGNVLPARPERRHRSTRRRQDAPPLPKRTVDPRTVGKTYTTPDGKTFRPSLFITLTCPSYGRVTSRRNAGRPGQPTTTRGRPATRCTSPRCSTGSCRTCAASSATTSSTSPRSSRNGASRRTSTSRCAAPSHAPNSARSSPRPTTRCGGRPPTRSASTAATCPSGTRTRQPTSTRTRGEVLPPGTKRSTPSATTTSRCTSPGSATASTPKASSPGPRTQAGASAT